MMTHDMLPERPLKRREFDVLVAQGLFADEKIELLHGKLIPMSPQNALHSLIITRLSRQLAKHLGDAHDLLVQQPIALDEDSEPEPDLAIVTRFVDKQDHPSDVKLVIEVAESSLAKDRGVKRGLYARGGVAEYWLVNVKAQTLEIYRQPQEGDYQLVHTLRGKDTVTHALVPGLLIQVGELFV